MIAQAQRDVRGRARHQASAGVETHEPADIARGGTERNRSARRYVGNRSKVLTGNRADIAVAASCAGDAHILERHVAHDARSSNDPEQADVLNFRGAGREGESGDRLALAIEDAGELRPVVPSATKEVPLALKLVPSA